MALTPLSWEYSDCAGLRSLYGWHTFHVRHHHQYRDPARTFDVGTAGLDLFWRTAGSARPAGSIAPVECHPPARGQEITASAIVVRAAAMSREAWRPPRTWRPPGSPLPYTKTCKKPNNASYSSGVPGGRHALLRFSICARFVLIWDARGRTCGCLYL